MPGDGLWRNGPIRRCAVTTKWWWGTWVVVTWPESVPQRWQPVSFIAWMHRRSTLSWHWARAIAGGICDSRNPLIATVVKRDDASFCRPDHGARRRNGCLFLGDLAPWRFNRPPARILDTARPAVGGLRFAFPPHPPAFTARGGERLGQGSGHFLSRIECELRPSIARISDE